MRRIPGAVRVAVALGCGYLLADRVLALEWSGTALRAMMIGTLFTLTLLFLVFPVLDVRPWRRPAPRVPR